MKEEVFVKEKNNGKLGIEYYQDDRIVAVVYGLHYHLNPNPYNDLIGPITGTWDYNIVDTCDSMQVIAFILDCDGKIKKLKIYPNDSDDNYWDNEDNKEQELTAVKAISNCDSIQIIAYALGYNGKIEKIEIYPNKMGYTGKKYFNLSI